MPAAVHYYRNRFGFSVVHEDTGFAVLLRDDAENNPQDTDFGTREFATLDMDGNLITFFRPDKPRR